MNMSTGTNTLTINGKEREFSAGIPGTLTDLLEHLNINEATVVAEIDGRIIERQNFAQTHLSAGQSIELVRFVGGG
jgi:thiamine biosynthesis protein ThiS